MGAFAHWFRVFHVAFFAAVMNVSVAIAQDNTTSPAIGPETNLPMPRFVSLRANEANVRRGPSLSHRIDWIFKRQNMPLQVIAEYGHWRRVIDRDGQGGWVHYRMLSGARTVVIQEAETVLRSRPEPDAFETRCLSRELWHVWVNVTLIGANSAQAATAVGRSKALFGALRTPKSETRRLCRDHVLSTELQRRANDP